MSPPAAGTGWRLAAFAGLTALAGWRYAGVVAPSASGRVAALSTIAVTTAAAVTALRGRSGGGRWAAMRWAVVVVLLALALPAAGVPVRLLAPARWGALARHLEAGRADIGSTLWPYSGADAWTRVDLILGPAVALIGAAALAFWPASDGGRLSHARVHIRRMAALGLVLTVYVFGQIDSNGGSDALEGGLLLALIAAWMWLPALPRRRAAAAIAWLTAAGTVAIVLSSGLSGGRPWLDYRAWDLLGAADHGIRFAWDQTYGPLRWSRSQQIMFTVGASRSQLWKTTTLDSFDGIRFLRSRSAAPADQDLPLPLNGSWYRFARFTIAGLRSSLLPVEQGVTAGVNSGGRVDYEPDGTVATAARWALRTGTSYAVLSYVPDPAPADLRAAPPVLPAGYRRYTEFQLPGSSSAVTVQDARRILSSPYREMYRLARRLARGRRTTYDVVLAIEAYLQANGAYEENVPVRRYPLEAFLFTDHVGYCQQFSGAMALMLRMDGIPARIAAGFLPGSYDAAARQWVVRAVDAHSWVEVFFRGIGWVPFNPTPGRVTGPAQPPLFASARAAATTRLQAIAATVGGPAPAVLGPRPARRRRGAGAGVTAVIIVISLALVAALALAARWLAGSLRLRASLHGDSELAIGELVQALRRLGFAISSTATLNRVEMMVSVHGGPAAATYVRRLRDRSYRSPKAAGPSPTLGDRRRLRRGLTGRLGLGARLRGLWALPPGTMAWRTRRDQAGAP